MEAGGRLTRTMAAVLTIAVLAGCSREARSVYATPPQTPPHGPDDPRVPFYQGNAYQVSQGGRYFSWYGCAACHGQDAKGALALGDGVWAHGGGFDQVYASIAQRHPGERYGERIPTEQLWEIAAYVRDLDEVAPEKRGRQDRDQQAEPQASAWSGPQR